MQNMQLRVFEVAVTLYTTASYPALTCPFRYKPILPFLAENYNLLNLKLFNTNVDTCCT